MRRRPPFAAPHYSVGLHSLLETSHDSFHTARCPARNWSGLQDAELGESELAARPTLFYRAPTRPQPPRSWRGALGKRDRPSLSHRSLGFNVNALHGQLRELLVGHAFFIQGLLQQAGSLI